MNWIYYLLEANLYLTVFYLLYHFVLRSETWYQLNRAYLLICCVLAFVLPVVQIGALKPVEHSRQVVTIIRTHGLKNATVVQDASYSLQDYLFAAYLVGAITMGLTLLYKLVQLIRLIKKPENRGDNEYSLVLVGGSNAAFSFFNYLFIGEKVQGHDTVIRHELVHIRGKHSLDILFLEFLKIINWFNPIIYLLQISLKTVHEFIADEQTAALENDPIGYSSFLVNSAYGISGPSITHSFFNYNLLKKRIIMLHQKRSGKLARLKYLLALPVCLALLCMSTLGFTKNYGFLDLMPGKTLPAMKTPGDTDYHYNTDNITGKGYKYEETGYMENKKLNFRVIITEKNGETVVYYRNSSTKAQLALLQNKYGYTFPKITTFPKPPHPPKPPVPEITIDAPAQKLPPPPPPKNPEISIDAPVQKLLPPPPPKHPKPMEITIDPSGKRLLPPPPPKQPKALEITIDPQAQKIPPPPPPKNPGIAVNPPTEPKSPFDSLYRYVAKYCRYPAIALNKHIAGRGIVTFSINDGKIGNISILRNIDPAIDGEITRVANNFTGKLNVQSGRYALPVSYVVQDAKGDNIGVTSTASGTAKNGSGSALTVLDEVVVVGFI